jgi:hypothetical protein
MRRGKTRTLVAHMEDFRADGLDVWFPPEVRILETIRFIDRRYLGVIANRPGTQLFYASLMRESLPYEQETSPWWPHTLHSAITDTAAHAREMVVNAYEALTDRPATNS